MNYSSLLKSFVSLVVAFLGSGCATVLVWSDSEDYSYTEYEQKTASRSVPLDGVYYLYNIDEVTANYVSEETCLFVKDLSRYEKQYGKRRFNKKSSNDCLMLRDNGVYLKYFIEDLLSLKESSAISYIDINVEERLKSKDKPSFIYLHFDVFFESELSEDSIGKTGLHYIKKTTDKKYQYTSNKWHAYLGKKSSFDKKEKVDINIPINIYHLGDLKKTKYRYGEAIADKLLLIAITPFLLVFDLVLCPLSYLVRPSDPACFTGM